VKRALLFCVLSGCLGNVVSPGGGTGAGPNVGGTGGSGGGSVANCTPVGRNDEIRLALTPVCQGCHTTGNLPFFASLEAFENGLVYDTRYVTPGNPSTSVLVQLLKGTVVGNYPQMPPQQSYASLLAAGQATLSISDIEDWITNLPPPGTQLAEPAADMFSIRRLDADEMVVSLMDQLGLTVDDFVYTAQPDWLNNEWQVLGGTLFIWSKDWSPGISEAYGSDYRATERYQALGGAVTLEYRKKDTTLGPAAMQTLVQASQAWCRWAIEKPGNTAVLRYVSLGDTSATKTDAIKQNISALWLRMLGDPPAQTDVDEMFSRVYLTYEPLSTKAAWTAVCAALVRNPQWLSY
jgi:hypothetical protein